MATEQQQPREPGEPNATPAPAGERGADKLRLDRSDEAHQFVDTSGLDFDPDDGLYSGTAVTGGTEIPGPHVDHETGELTEPDDPPTQAPPRP